jgi:hypothetical protein
VAKEVRIEGFDLLSKELCSASTSSQQAKQQQQQQPNHQMQSPQPQPQQQNSTNMMEGDAWLISMSHAERMLLSHMNRNRVFSILKTLRDRHLDFDGSAVSNYLIKVCQHCLRNT